MRQILGARAFALFGSISLLVLAVAAAGCGGGDGANRVSGKVTFNGKPLPAGKITASRPTAPRGNSGGRLRGYQGRSLRYVLGPRGGQGGRDRRDRGFDPGGGRHEREGRHVRRDDREEPVRRLRDEVGRNRRR